MKKLNDKEEQIRLIARFLMDEHGLQNVGLTFRFMTRTLGQYSHYKQRIQLSTYFINSKSARIIVNTILHEIAHALTPLHGHDRIWKAKAEEIGALPRANANDEQRLQWIKEKEGII